MLYLATSFLLTGVVNYTKLNVAAPVAIGMEATGLAWGTYLVLVGSIMGLSTVMLVMLLGQSRVFYSMSRDGLLPEWAGKIHPKFRTPYISSRWKSSPCGRAACPFTAGFWVCSSPWRT